MNTNETFYIRDFEPQSNRRRTTSENVRVAGEEGKKSTRLVRSATEGAKN